MSNISATIEQQKSIDFKTKFFRKMIFKNLYKIKNGSIIIEDQLGTTCCGELNHTNKINLHITNLNFYNLVFLKGSIGFAIAFMNNFIQTSNLTNLLIILAKNLNFIEKAESNITSYFFNLTQKTLYLLNKNTPQKAKTHIMQHYDISNDFFKLFLDEGMSYSSLMFYDKDNTLNIAAYNKIKNLIKKLQIRPKEQILEIGTGWGALAIEIALKHDCRVTTTTISNAQFAYTKHKIDSLKLNHKINLLNIDYRSLNGKYDKIISVEMIEAVGHQYFTDYFKICSELLNDDGLFVLQCILIRDQEYERAKNEVDFIKKFIFPGGCLPSMQKIMQIISKHTDLSLFNFQDITYDYAITLRKWRENFHKNSVKILQLGFDEYFLKMWEYYFSYCEAGFLNRNIICAQIVLTKKDYSPSFIKNE